MTWTNVKFFFSFPLQSALSAWWCPCPRVNETHGGPLLGSWCWSSWWCCSWCFCCSTAAGRRRSRPTLPPCPSPPHAPQTLNTPCQVREESIVWYLGMLLLLVSLEIWCVFFFISDVPHSYHHYYSNPSYHTLSQSRPPLPHFPNNHGRAIKASANPPKPFISDLLWLWVINVTDFH